MIVNCNVSSDDTAPSAGTFTPQSGPKVSPNVKTPEECFALFFGDSLLDYIVDCTNEYAQKKIAAKELTDHALYRNWRPVTREEMKGFLAIILNMGIIQLSNLKDYWSLLKSCVSLLFYIIDCLFVYQINQKNKIIIL